MRGRAVSSSSSASDQRVAIFVLNDVTAEVPAVSTGSAGVLFRVIAPTSPTSVARRSLSHSSCSVPS